MNPAQTQPKVLDRTKNHTDRQSDFLEFIPLDIKSKKKVRNMKVRVEKVLISRLEAGDKTVFSIIFSAYYRDLILFAMSITHNQDLAEEIVQDTFVKLWEDHSSIRIQSLKSFLLTIVRNKCIDWFRHNKIKSIHSDIIIERSSDFTCETDNYLLFSELQEQLESALNKLPDEISGPFRMNRNQGLRYNEIAEILGVSVRTIEVRIGKALHMLRNYLKEYFLSVLALTGMFLDEINGLI